MAEILDIRFVMPDGREVRAAGFAEQFAERFGNISSYLDSDEYYKDVSDEVFDVLEGAMDTRFEAEGNALGGNDWAANSTEWAAFKLLKTGKSIIGEFTGDMKRSYTQRTDSDAVRTVEGKALIFGSKTPYAKWFAELRPLLVFDNTVRNNIFRAFQRAAVERSKEQLKS